MNLLCFSISSGIENGGRIKNTNLISLQLNQSLFFKKPIFKTTHVDRRSGRNSLDGMADLKFSESAGNVLTAIIKYIETPV